ncbi:MAG: hypothetical protein R2798_03940 [Chitinophagales bacterium]
MTKCQGAAPFSLTGNATGGTGSASFTWSPATYLSNPNSPVPTVTFPSNFTGSITYTLNVTQGGYCRPYTRYSNHYRRSCSANCTTVQACNDNDCNTINDVVTMGSAGGVCVACAGTYSPPPSPNPVNCWDDYQYNASNCTWSNVGVQDPMPSPLECWETATFNNQLASGMLQGTYKTRCQV